MLGVPVALSFPLKQFRQPRAALKRVTAIAVATGAIALNLITPALAGDPFRNSSPHAIDDQTEAAFRAIFEQGDYRRAEQLLESPNPNEPLAYAIKASLAYVNEDWDALGENATLTREAAERLQATDPLRSNLYTAAGIFLEGAYTLSTEDTVRATPTLLGKLQQVFDKLDEAEAIDPNDPELNLLKGYMDLMLAVNLPFSNPQQAIERLEAYGSPEYLVNRGIAIGYRDLNQQEQALTAVDSALAETPDNPDLFYLKAQILVRQGKHRESLEFFQQAIAKQAQLPRNLVIQIAFEACRAQNRVAPRPRNCDAERDNYRESGTLPPIPSP